MKFRAEIDVMPLEALLDPQGKAVSNNMKNIGLPEIGRVFKMKFLIFQILINQITQLFL